MAATKTAAADLRALMVRAQIAQARRNGYRDPAIRYGGSQDR